MLGEGGAVGKRCSISKTSFSPFLPLLRKRPFLSTVPPLHFPSPDAPKPSSFIAPQHHPSKKSQQRHRTRTKIELKRSCFEHSKRASSFVCMWKKSRFNPGDGGRVFLPLLPTLPPSVQFQSSLLLDAFLLASRRPPTHKPSIPVN